MSLLKRRDELHLRVFPGIGRFFLKIESDLQFDCSPGQRSRSFAKLAAVGKSVVVAETEVCQIKLIENIKEIRAQIDSRTFL